MELIFARESTIQQWTPLMFAAQWIVIACIKYGNDLDQLYCRQRMLLLIVRRLLLESNRAPENGGQCTHRLQP